MIMNKVLHKYKNGNVDVTIHEDGTKIREWPDGEIPNVEYPESCDLKITQYCDMAKICVYCHEMSNKEGKHGDLSKITKIWSKQLPGTELAIGGGNPLAHPDLKDFLVCMKEFQIIPNVTVNMMHMKKFAPMIREFQKEKLIYGLGISYRGKNSLSLLPTDIDYSNAVFHMIMGIHDLEDCYEVIDWCKERNITPKILLLGYKTFGNGINCYTPELKLMLNTWSKLYVYQLINCRDHIVVSFDNLAIEQLDLQNKLDKDVWEEFYQGLDGNHTFYIDAVKEEVARTSTSDKRYPITENDCIKEIFGKVKV